MVRNNPVILNSRNIYGSSRLGIEQEAVVMTSGHTGDTYQYKLGYKAYELANHPSMLLRTSLGNVLNVVSDMKYYDATENYYKADVISGTNYYPFGMTLSDELYAGNYPYGFNGMERCNEIFSSLMNRKDVNL